MSWEVIFYKTETGKEVIAEFLNSLPIKHKAKAFWEINLLAEKGTELKKPYVKHIEDDLWELRIKFASNNSRVFYFIPSQTTIVLLHGFVKKSQKTPYKEIAIAKKRLKNYKRRKLNEF